MKKRIIAFLMTGVMLLSLAACGNTAATTEEKSGEESAETAETSEPAGDTIKIGYMCEETTALGFSNQWTDIATYMWLDTINQNGGIDGKQVEFVRYDAQNDPSLATQRLSEMKADGMVACLEIACAGKMAPAIAEWCAENKFPVIHTCNSATAFTIETSSPYMFTVAVNSWGMSKILAENAIEKEGNTTFAYIGVDEACCLDAEKFLEREGQKYNEAVKETDSFRVSWDDSQFSTIISTLLSKTDKPDMILQQGGGSNFINIVQQANMYSAFEDFDIYNDLAVDTASCSDLAASGEFPYGHIKGFAMFPWWEDSTKEFTDLFEETRVAHDADEGLVPGDLAYYAYSCANVLGKALEACVEDGADYSDGDTLTKYIHNVKYSDFCGDHYFRDFDNQFVFDAYYVISEDSGEELNHLPIADLSTKYVGEDWLPSYEDMDGYAKEVGAEDWDVSAFWTE